MASLEITGRLRDRLIQAVVLLYLLDQSRGEPTTYGLDQDASSVDLPRELFLKNKFLDSCALVCAVRRDKHAVSAACLEEGLPGGTVLRIASNSGVSDDTVISLQRIVGILYKISARELDPFEGEKCVLLDIIQLDISKIQKYIMRLKTCEEVFSATVPELRARLEASRITSPLLQEFIHWFEELLMIKDLPEKPTAMDLFDHIVRAQTARKLYYSFLKVAFGTPQCTLPHGVKLIFKLGRYGIAARAFVQTSIEIPALFNPMVVESVPAPPKMRYVIQEGEVPFARMLRRVPEIKVEDIVPRLMNIWNTNDPENLFRETCPTSLFCHAEMQLLSFYDHNPTRRPQVRFMGVSKKSCYLCWRFIHNHPSEFSVSSCHQKLYQSWIPAPSTNNKVYIQTKEITLDMCKKMERIVREGLLHRFRLKQLMPADSTAGVSLSGLTDLRDRDLTEFNRHGGVKLSFERPSKSPVEVSSPTANPEEPLDDSQPSSESEMTPTSTQRDSTEDTSTSPFSSIVIHFKDQRDETKQDIIMVDTMLDPDTHQPSWSKLVNILNSDNSFGLVFRNSDFLLINKNFRVRNERQFLSCMIWLLNQGTWNSEALICDGHSSA